MSPVRLPRVWTWLAATLLALAGPVTEAVAGPPDLGARIDAVAGRAIADGRLVGAVVLVMRNGVTVHHRAYGLADREAGQPLAEDAIFRLASCSKTIVSVAALALVDQGRLRLDDRVTRWLPRFTPTTSDGYRPDITIHQLLTHTAGLSYSFLEPADGAYRRANVSTGLDQPGLTMQEELRRIERAGLAYPPGTGWQYSVAIDVLGAVIEAVTHQPLAAAVRALVADPLALRDMDFDVRDPSRLAVPYFLADGRAQRMADPQDVDFPGIGPLRFAPSRHLDRNSFPSGGAGMNATASDFARLLDAVRAGGGGVLRAATAQAMLTNQVGDLPIVLGHGWGFGYGGAVLQDAAAAHTPQTPGTWLWGGVYGHSWFVDPGRGLTVVALTNTAPEGDSGPFTIELRDAVYGNDSTAAAY
jgi:CubicO group peptidase (beta-lactamase class C family)